MMPDDTVCAQYRDWLAASAAGVLPQAQQRAIEEHLAQCERCSKELAQWQSIGALTRQRAELVPTPDFTVAWEQLQQRLDTPIQTSTRQSRRRVLLREIQLPDLESTVDLPNYQHPRHLMPAQGTSHSATHIRNAVTRVVACAAIVLLLVGVIVTFGHPNLGGPGNPPVTPVPTIPPGQGWTPAGPPWAQQIVFAPSEPQIAYVCGTTIPPGQTPDNRDQNIETPVEVGTSGDSGHTWQTLTTHLTALTCQITVNPRDAHDLLLAVGHYCVTCSTPAPGQLYRSGDGGRSWRLVQFPPLGATGSTQFITYGWAWQGSAVFVMPCRSGSQCAGLLAVSVAGGPFTWVHQQALFEQIPASMQLYKISATTSTVYADFVNVGPDCFNGGSSPTGCYLTKQSSDLGTTWTLFQPTYRGQPVSPLDQPVSIADGQTLLGRVYPGQNGATWRYLRSADGGATWTPLPEPPGDLAMSAVATTPNGIAYSEMGSTSDISTSTPGVYRLAPGAGAWVLVGALPDNVPWSGIPLVISWDGQDHPLALWTVVSASSSVVDAGLATHAP
jgi:hypothetical protein